MWYSCQIYLSYDNIVTNTKKIINIEELQKLILTELFEFCIIGHQKLKILQILIPKAAEFLRRFHIDIKGSLLVTFSGF